jgi:ABC-type phosphate transport system substrate-binding protein
MREITITTKSGSRRFVSTKLRASGLALGFLLAIFPAAAFSQNGVIAVVVNPNNPVSAVSSSDLRKIFAGEKRSWPGGTPIKLIVRTPGCLERIALLRLLGMSESEYKHYWTSQVLRGEASSEPVAVFSNGFQKEAVRALPGSIALMDVEDAKSGVKVLKVDGHLPGEAGYPLH